MMDRTDVVEHMDTSILVVEDDPNHRELISEAIKEANLLNNVLFVEDGLETIRYLEREGKYSNEEKYPWPTLILLDLKLPGMNGKEVLRHIKSEKGTQAIPVIVLTSSALDKDVDECYKLGANSYIIKPLSANDFIKKIKEIPLYWLLVSSLPKEVE